MSDAEQNGNGIGLDDVDFDDGTFTCELTPDAEVRIKPRDDADLGVKVVVGGDAGESVIYHDSHKRDFYTKQTKLEIKNKIRENHTDGDAIGARFVELCKMLTNHHGDIQTALRPPAVGSLLDQTDKVEILGGTEATFAVTMTREGRIRKLEFSTDEIMGADPKPLRNKYGSAFYKKVSLEPEVWEDLAEEWIEMAEEVAVEHMTETEAVAGEIVDTLSRRLSYTLDREGLYNDTLTAWYEESNKSGHDRGDADDDDAVVWVRTGAVRDVLKDEGKTKEYFNTLSPELKSLGVTYTTSKRIRTGHGRKPCLGFNAGEDGLAVPRSAATNSEEVQPE